MVYRARAAEFVIQGIALGCFGREKDKWTYQVGYAGACYRTLQEHEIFLTEQEALQFAIAKGKQLEIDSAAQVYLKEKPEKSWAWHVTYHRREMQRNEKQAEYHARKLGIAREKAKK